MQTLSDGYSFLYFFELIEEEFSQFFLLHLSNNKEKYPIYFIEKISLLYGLPSLNLNTNIHEENIMKKLYYDIISLVSLKDTYQLENDKSTNARYHKANERLTERLNKNKKDNIKKFDELFLDELQGLLIVFSEILIDSINKIPEVNSDNEIAMDKDILLDFRNLIYNLFKYKKIEKELPSLTILSGLNAAIILDNKRKFKNNDHDDIKHAAMALPYCDYFFTENSLKHLICSKKLNYDEKYNIIVKSKTEESIIELNNISILNQ